MNCASFEQGLARLVAADAATDRQRQELLEQLNEHAAACAECRASADLIDLLAARAEERELVDDPGDDYWAEFEARLRPRLVPGPVRSRGRWWVVAAAVLLFALVAGWLWREPGESGKQAVAEAPQVAFPPSLVQSLDRASPAEIENQLAALEAWGPGDAWFDDAEASAGPAAWDGGLFPEVEQLDDETRRRLLEWLRDENRRAEGAEG